MILAGDYIPKNKSVKYDLPPGLILANLEGPVIGDAKLHPIQKSGPVLSTKKLSFDGHRFAFALANNHIMDYGADGLQQTLKILDDAKVPHCGAGKNIDDAQKPMIILENGKRIGVLSCCERQFGMATKTLPGCAEKGLWLVDAIKNLKSNVDYVIVSCHVAMEHSPFPSPYLREFYHLLIDSGADCIHGHHAHVPQGWECYHDRFIFYGMGNFTVDPLFWRSKNHRRSLLAQINFSNKSIDTSVINAQVESNNDKEILVRYCSSQEYSDFSKYIDFCNSALNDNEVLSIAWQAISVLLFDRLYGVFLHTPGFSQTNPLTWRNRMRYVVDGLAMGIAVLTGRKPRYFGCRPLVWQNIFQCESHVQCISSALQAFNAPISEFNKLNVWLTKLIEFGLTEIG